MPVFREAFSDLERNWKLVAVYCAALSLIVLASATGDYLLLQNIIGPLSVESKRIYDLSSELIVTILGALVQTVVLANLGKDIDRPLFKLRGAGDALKRFFAMWLLFNLIQLAFIEGIFSAVTNESPLADPLRILLLFWSVVFVPLGACVMFTGKFDRSEFFASIVPLTHFGFQTFGILFIGGIQFYLFMGLIKYCVPNKTPSLHWIIAGPALNSLMTLFECLIFAATWRVCMLYRDTAHDDDFDF